MTWYYFAKWYGHCSGIIIHNLHISYEGDYSAVQFGKNKLYDILFKTVSNGGLCNMPQTYKLLLYLKVNFRQVITVQFEYAVNYINN